MKLELISQILEATSGVRKEGAVFHFPEDSEVSVYIALTAEVLTIPRVSRFSAASELVTIETTKGERFYFTPELVAGIKVGVLESKSGSRGAGFR